MAVAEVIINITNSHMTTVARISAKSIKPAQGTIDRCSLETPREPRMEGNWYRSMPQNKAQARSIEPAKDGVAQPDVDSGGECIMRAAVREAVGEQ